MKFTHLHMHTHYSLLDGLSKIDELLDYVKELGMDSCAITDHGVLYGAVEFYQKAKKRGIKPIIGCEVYMAYERMDQRRPNIDDKRYHLVLLVKNETGYKNLVKLVTKAHLEGFYYKPRIDDELLAQHCDGLIAMTGCVQGRIPRYILAGKIDEAEKLALKYQNMFGQGNFYLELQRHPNLPRQKEANQGLIALSKKLNIPLVATNDCHYLRKEDNEAQDVLMMISTDTKSDNPNRKTMKFDDYSVKSPETMIADFKDTPSAIENTQKIMKQCNFDFKLGGIKLPYYQVPDNKQTDEYLRKLCEQGLEKRFGKNHPNIQTIKERMNYELSIIHKMEFDSYFLIVQDFVNWAKQNRIVVGPGRGCFLPGAKILLSNGFQKNIEEIKIGDKVISRLGNQRTIKKILNYDTEEEIAVISAKMPTFDLKLTKDHKVLAAKHQMCPIAGIKKTICKPTCPRSCRKKLWKNYKLKWIKAENLQKNDFLLYPISKQKYSKKEVTFDLANLNLDPKLKNDKKYVWYEIGTNKLIQKKIPRYIKLDKKLATFLGFYVAEGWSRTKQREAAIGFGFHKNEKEYIGEVKKLFKEIFNLKGSVINHKSRNSTQVYAYSLIVGKFLEKLCGKGAFNKCVPNEIFNSSQKIIIPFLTALFKGDGSQKGAMRMSFDSISYNLISQVKMLLSQLEIMSSIKFRKHKNKNWHTAYKLRVSGKQLFRFNELFKNFQIPIKDQKFYRNDTFIDKNYIWFPVKEIKFEQYKGKVYDLSVEKDVSYVANDIAVHNSAAGSIVSYLLNITDIDPIKYNLLFERFLNPSRVSMPDIDLDFTDWRRDEVINYIRQKYGEDKVAQIITFGTMASRAVIRDVGRALNYQYSYCDVLAKKIPFGFTLDQTLKKVNEFREVYESDEEAARLIDLAKKLEGVVRHASTHACGVVMSKEPLTDLVPLQHPTQNDDNIVTQYGMRIIEALGLLKMDLLGLKNLTIIEDTLTRVYKVQNKSLKIENIPLDDAKVYKILQKGESTSIFQLESDGMKRYLKQLKPTEFEDIIAMVSLYRPGPIAFIPEYIKGKENPNSIKYLNPKLEPILKSTYGIMIYQEQLMQIAQQFAGFSLAEADILRKAVGKKIKELLFQQKEKFIQGAVNQGASKEIAQKIWEWILPFASYGFNRSHGASYAMIAYRTAYLKVHYPVEFMAAVLTSEKNDVEKIAFLIDECNRMKIEVLPPDINESFRNFSVVPIVRKIRFGLLAIKNVGENVVEAIVEERKQQGEFASIADFIERIPANNLNKKSMESLIKAGAFDKFEERNKLLENLERLLEWARETQKNKENGQKGLFESMAQDGGTNHNTPTLVNVSPIPEKEKLLWEKELLGLYISGHPCENFKKVFAGVTVPLKYVCETAHITGKRVKVGGIISSIKKINTKTGRQMLFVKLEDQTSKIELVVFPTTLEQSPIIFEENKIIIVDGRVDNRGGVPKIICQNVEEVIES